MSNHKQSREIDDRLTRIEVDTSSAIVELLEPTYFLTYTTHVRVNSICVQACMSLMATIQRKLTIPYQHRTIWNELTVRNIRENIYSHYFNIDGQMQYLSYRCLCDYERFRNTEMYRMHAKLKYVKYSKRSVEYLEGETNFYLAFDLLFVVILWNRKCILLCSSNTIKWLKIIHIRSEPYKIQYSLL